MSHSYFQDPTVSPTPSLGTASSTPTFLPIVPSNTPTQIITPSTTSTAIATSTPLTTSTLLIPILSTKYSPLITDIQTRKSLTSTGVRIYADIYFQDKDGDSYLVTYEVVNSTTKGIQVKDDPIPSAPQDQIAGTQVTVTWDCLGKGYVVTLNAIVLDKSGNQSNRYSLVFDCR